MTLIKGQKNNFWRKTRLAVIGLFLASTAWILLTTYPFRVVHGAPGDLDISFNPMVGVNGTVFDIGLQSDGKIIVGGQFSLYNGVPRNGIARINPDGSLDMSFDPGTGVTTSTVKAIEVLSDGKILIGGYFSAYNGVARDGIVRLNPNGSLDPSFNAGVSSSFFLVEDIALQPDGKIVIAGENAGDVQGQPFTGLGRLLPSGTRDTTFVPANFQEYGGAIESIAIQPDGKIVVGGEFIQYGGVGHNGISRANADGTLDTSFNPGGKGALTNSVFAVALQPDGKILIGGNFSQYNGTTRNRVARLNTDGTLDTGFNDPGAQVRFSVRSLYRMSDGRVLVGGFFDSYGGASRHNIARFLANGSVDTSFNPGAGLVGPRDPAVQLNGLVEAINIQSDGKILLGGDFVRYNNVRRGGLVRTFSDGSLDATANFADILSRASVITVAQQSNGKILIGGLFTQVNGIDRLNLARLNIDGTLDTTFDPGGIAVGLATDTVEAIVVQSDGKILVGGSVGECLFRLNANGTPDPTFDNGFGADSDNPIVKTIALQPDGKILFAGRFGRYNSVGRTNVARANTNGTIDASFNPGLGPLNSSTSSNFTTVNGLVIQPNGKIIIGGDFNLYNGITRNRVARLNSDGSLDTTFDIGADPGGSVQDLVLQPDGKLIIGGTFSSIAGTPRTRIARVNSDGGLDNTFQPGAGASLTVFDLELQTNGKVVLVGRFSTFDGVSKNRIARLNANGALDLSFNTGTGADDAVNAVAIQSDGDILVGGVFFNLSGLNRAGLGRLEGDPLAGPSPTPTPTWEPVVLTSNQVELKTWVLQGRSYAYVKLSFPNDGYRVASWGQPVNAASVYSADAALEKFTGPSVQAVTTTAQIYDLGPLANGNYTFNFKNSGTTVKSLAFTISSTAPPANPIDNQREFVRQQYRDFLNREADQAGEDFWTDNITKCNDPARRPPGQTAAQCRLRQRETTSAAFFLSPEFQYTGYYVYRMFVGGLGRQPKLSEFTPDALFVGNGIIVNGQLSAAKINQNKADFATQFVNCTDPAKYRCAEFKAIYDSLTNQQYVTRLFTNTGVNASAADRTALVNALNGGTETRAGVLRKVVDGINVIAEGNQQFTTSYGQAFYNSELNEAFVQLEYFGYMKRDPDTAGYAFWLGKLNQFGGDFVAAEMVLAFISSPEYRSRFGAP